MKRLYVFENKNLTEDVVDPKTKKVIKYKSVAVIAQSEQEARDLDKNLDSDYLMVKDKDLPKHWN